MLLHEEVQELLSNEFRWHVRWWMTFDHCHSRKNAIYSAEHHFCDEFQVQVNVNTVERIHEKLWARVWLSIAAMLSILSPTFHPSFAHNHNNTESCKLKRKIWLSKGNQVNKCTQSIKITSTMDIDLADAIDESMQQVRIDQIDIVNFV